MNGKSRFLPRLNLCYLQKKAYEIHLKKMSSIQHRSNNVKRANSESPEPKQKQFESMTGNRMLTIQERSQKTVTKMSPYRKKMLKETERENMRLFQAIQKCPSTISRKSLSQHNFLNQQFKGRICRYAVMPGSNRTLLKCEISLDKINKKMKESRLCTFSADSNSKNPSQVRKYAKTEQSQNKESLSASKIHDQNDFSQNLILRRNKNKINNHFQRSEITLRTKQKLQGFRENVENIKKMHTNPIYKWKTRCFTTQMESHSKQHQ